MTAVADRILARATAKGPSYQEAVGGAVVAFTAADVGHALAGRVRGGEFEALPDGAVRVLLLKYASPGPQDAGALVRELVSAVGKPKTWRDQIACRAVAVAVASEFLSARRCRICLGSRFTDDRGKVEPCEDCNGTGYIAWTSAHRARACGFENYETFRRREPERIYGAMLAQLITWEDAGFRCVAQKVRQRNVLPDVTRRQRAHLEAIAAGSSPRVARKVFENLQQIPGMAGLLRFIGDGELGYVTCSKTSAELKRAIRALDTCPET